MRVLLTRDVPKLGKKGEIKEVKDGYGQNFLIAKGFAKLATPEVIEEWKAEQAQKEAELKAQIEEANAIKTKLEATPVKIERKKAPAGIKGSVTNSDIAKAIEEQYGQKIDKKEIALKRHIKTEGVHEVDVKLGHGIHATLKVEVIGVEDA